MGRTFLTCSFLGSCAASRPRRSSPPKAVLNTQFYFPLICLRFVVLHLIWSLIFLMEAKQLGQIPGGSLNQMHRHAVPFASEGTWGGGWLSCVLSFICCQRPSGESRFEQQAELPRAGQMFWTPGLSSQSRASQWISSSSSPSPSPPLCHRRSGTSRGFIDKG